MVLGYAYDSFLLDGTGCRRLSTISPVTRCPTMHSGSWLCQFLLLNWLKSHVKLSFYQKAHIKTGGDDPVELVIETTAARFPFVRPTSSGIPGLRASKLPPLMPLYACTLLKACR